jgi:truncated hemoglobin YjbI
MTHLRQNKNLAYQISLCRIALVVDAVHRQMQTQQMLAEPFDINGDNGEQRARLTYFWWVVLGGNKLRDIDWEVRGDSRTGISPELLKNWIVVFRQAALPILGREFTEGWIQKAEQAARELLITDEDDAAELATAT